jgi:hypothetical protein
MLAAGEAIGAEIPGGWRGEIVSPTMRSSAALNRGETEDIQYLFVYERVAARRYSRRRNIFVLFANLLVKFSNDMTSCNVKVKVLCTTI